MIYVGRGVSESTTTYPKDKGGINETKKTFVRSLNCAFAADSIENCILMDREEPRIVYGRHIVERITLESKAIG